MSGLWKFDYQNQDNTIPDHNEVIRRRKLINYRDLELDEPNATAFLRREGMIVNLGGIGKGYAVDRARAILRDRGFRDFLIQFGGDMYAAGREGDRAWRLGIQDPRGLANRIFATMDVSERTFSTSGDYARFFIKDGRRYPASRPDLIDPAHAILPDHRNTLQYLNPAAFAPVALSPQRIPIRPGTAGHNAFRGPGLWVLDFSFGKNFRVTEQIGLQLRADMFNALNHTNLGNPTNSIDDPNFGKIFGTGGARTVQLNARLTF